LSKEYSTEIWLNLFFQISKKGRKSRIEGGKVRSMKRGRKV
jgi:hypothetical protein